MTVAPIRYGTKCPHCDKKFDGVSTCSDPRCLRAAKIVAYIRHKGSDATDVRDAAHEACHALQWSLKGRWARDTIMNKNPYKRVPAQGIYDEITARAVEGLVVRGLGLPYEQDKWVLMMVMETLKFDRIALPGFDWVKNAIVEREKSKRALGLAEQILAFADLPLPRSRKKSA